MAGYTSWDGRLAAPTRSPCASPRQARTDACMPGRRCPALCRIVPPRTLRRGRRPAEYAARNLRASFVLRSSLSTQSAAKFLRHGIVCIEIVESLASIQASRKALV
eukprot:364709-Chlamydomonas_euryale.AAC.5